MNDSSSFGNETWNNNGTIVDDGNYTDSNYTDNSTDYYANITDGSPEALYLDYGVRDDPNIIYYLPDDINLDF